MSSFSSRGVTLKEISFGGYGRPKPDLVTLSVGVLASGLAPASTQYASHAAHAIFSALFPHQKPPMDHAPDRSCRTVQGTSIATPVAASAVLLLKSAARKRGASLNPASVKQILLQSAEKLPAGGSMFVQGAGQMRLERAGELVEEYVPAVTIWPDVFDMSEDPCDYFWPFCAQPIFHTSAPAIFNATMLNGVDAHGVVREAPSWYPANPAHADILDFHFTYSEHLWPFHGYLACHVSVKEQGKAFDGVVSGHVTVRVETPGGTSTASAAFKLRVVPTPDRTKRLLWDNGRNVVYPAGYAPRDNLGDKVDVLDLHGDHPHTNFRGLFEHLRALGYFVDVYWGDLSAVEASRYAALLLIDVEGTFTSNEIEAIVADVEERGLSLVVLADWFSRPIMSKVRFYDVSTRRWLSPVTGGANVPALNDLLTRWNVSFSTTDVVTSSSHHNGALDIASGTTVSSFPRSGTLFWTHRLIYEAAAKQMHSDAEAEIVAPIAGIFQIDRPDAGRIAVLSDSSCADDLTIATWQHGERPCFRLVSDLIGYAARGGSSSERRVASSPGIADMFLEKFAWNSNSDESGVGDGSVALLYQQMESRLHASEVLSGGK